MSELTPSVWKRLLDAADADLAPSEMTDARILAAAAARKPTVVPIAAKRTSVIRPWMALAASVAVVVGVGVVSQRPSGDAMLAADAGTPAVIAPITVDFAAGTANPAPAGVAALRVLAAATDLCAPSIVLAGGGASDLDAARRSAVAATAATAAGCPVRAVAARDAATGDRMIVTIESR